jgi:hypothetical protein
MRKDNGTNATLLIAIYGILIGLAGAVGVDEAGRPLHPPSVSSRPETRSEEW